MTLPQSKREAFLRLVCLSLGLVLLWLLKFVAEQQQATYDHMAYFSGFKLFSAGLNPYDPALLQQVQLEQLGSFASFQAHDVAQFSPARTWYPPWFFPMFSLLLFPPAVSDSLVLWLVATVTLGPLAGFFVWRCLGASRSSLLPCLLGSSLFPPVLTCFVVYNIGVVLAFSVAAFLWAVTQRRDLLAGLALVPLSCKPHLCVILGIALLYWTVRERRPGVLIGGTLGVFFMTGISELQVPGILRFWLENSWESPIWMFLPTLSCWLRFLLRGADGIPSWPNVVVPMLACVGVAGWLLLTRPRLNWLRDLPTLLCITLIAVPYCHVHDFAILLPVQICILAGAFAPQTASSDRRRLVGGLVALAAAALLTFPFPTQYWVWFCPAVLCLWRWFLRAHGVQGVGSAAKSGFGQAVV